WLLHDRPVAGNANTNARATGDRSLRTPGLDAARLSRLRDAGLSLVSRLGRIVCTPGLAPHGRSPTTRAGVPCGPLHDRARARCGRHGYGLSGPRSEARSCGGAEGAPP